MDEKPDVSPTPNSDLASAVRRAREENAERAEAIANLREIEAGRLALLESALKAVVRQAPPEVDLFDLTLTQGDKPRLFIDMVAFVEMARDRRAYRFFQDTVHGRVLIAQGEQMSRIVSAVTNYVARRLVERERALAANAEAESADAGEPGLMAEFAPAPEARKPATWSMRPSAPPALGVERPLASPVPAAAVAEPAPLPGLGKRRWRRRLADALSYLVMTLGSVTLALLLALGAYLVWTTRLHDLWTQWMHGAPPF
jgi:hypothetical protein